MAVASAARVHLLCDEPAVPGLLWAMRFDDEGNGRLVEPEEGLPALGVFGEGFLWLHFNLVDTRVATLIEAGQLGPKRLVAAAFTDDDHQRVAFEDGHVSGVVADLVHGSRSGRVDGRFHFVLGPRFLVSGRHHPIAGPDAARERAASGKSVGTPIQLLELAIGHAIGAMAESGTRMSDLLDAIEDRFLDGRCHGQRTRISPIRRDSVRLHRQLLGLRSVFHRLEQVGEAKGVPSDDIATATRIAQRLDALDRDISGVIERARLLQEELSAQVAEQSNRQLYMLSILTALFLPPTLITGIFGMNTQGLPLAEHVAGSTIAILMAAGSALAAYLLIRRLGIRAPRD